MACNELRSDLKNIYNRSLSSSEIQELYNKTPLPGQHSVTVYAKDITEPEFYNKMV